MLCCKAVLRCTHTRTRASERAERAHTFYRMYEFVFYFPFPFYCFFSLLLIIRIIIVIIIINVCSTCCCSIAESVVSIARRRSVVHCMCFFDTCSSDEMRRICFSRRWFNSMQQWVCRIHLQHEHDVVFVEWRTPGRDCNLWMKSTGSIEMIRLDLAIYKYCIHVQPATTSRVEE